MAQISINFWDHCANIIAGNKQLQNKTHCQYDDMSDGYASIKHDYLFDRTKPFLLIGCGKVAHLCKVWPLRLLYRKLKKVGLQMDEEIEGSMYWTITKSTVWLYAKHSYINQHYRDSITEKYKDITK
jgi:hypothetical protein